MHSKLFENFPVFFYIQFWVSQELLQSGKREVTNDYVPRKIDVSIWRTLTALTIIKTWISGKRDNFCVGTTTSTIHAHSHSIQYTVTHGICQLDRRNHIRTFLTFSIFAIGKQFTAKVPMLGHWAVWIQNPGLSFKLRQEFEDRPLLHLTNSRKMRLNAHMA